MIFASLGIAAIAAYCVYNEANKVAPGMYVALTEEGYICTYDENTGKVVLHEGKVKHLKNGYSRFAVGLDSVKFEYNCGEEIISNSKFSVHKEKPSDKHYQEVCEDCFKDEKTK